MKRNGLKKKRINSDWYVLLSSLQLGGETGDASQSRRAPQFQQRVASSPLQATCADDSWLSMRRLSTRSCPTTKPTHPSQRLVLPLPTSLTLSLAPSSREQTREQRAAPGRRVDDSNRQLGRMRTSTWREAVMVERMARSGNMASRARG